MKALSVKQPYSTLITKGVKDIENRSYKTNFRGKVLIHASAKFHDRVKDRIHGPLFTKEQRAAAGKLSEASECSLFKTSAIVGEVEIIDCVQNSESVWAEQGAWHWVLANATHYDEPILNVKGKLSFWEFDKQ